MTPESHIQLSRVFFKVALSVRFQFLAASNLSIESIHCYSRGIVDVRHLRCTHIRIAGCVLQMKICPLWYAYIALFNIDLHQLNIANIQKP